MPKYRSKQYGTFLYGGASLLAYSVEPMSILVRSLTEVFVGWQSPQGTFSRIRLVRNQNGFPETSEDGIVVWEEYADETSVTRIDIVDGLDNPGVIGFVPGKMVYYRVFLYTNDNVWVVAGSIFGVIPKEAGSQDRLFGVLPRVFTSIEQNPLGEPDTRIRVTDEGDTSLSAGAIYDFATFRDVNLLIPEGQTKAKGVFVNDLYNFLGGIGFTFDEFITWLDLLVPKQVDGEKPSSLSYLEFLHLGLVPETGLPTRNQKRLIREANYLYSRKGTMSGVSAYLEALTGYAPTIQMSPNLMLTPQDSTFYQSTGNWVPTNASIVPFTGQTPPTAEFAIDDFYTCQITASASGNLKLGVSNPILLGIPVEPETDYEMSFMAKTSTSTVGMYARTIYYDGKGNQISVRTSTTATVGTSWTRVFNSGLTPANCYYVGLEVGFDAAGTHWIDQVFFGATSSPFVYREARAASIYLDTRFTNLIVNPSFEDGFLSWSSTGSPTITQDADVTDLAYSGVSSAKIVASSAWTFSPTTMTVDDGQYYTVSLYAKTTAPITLTVTVKDTLTSDELISDTLTIPITTSWTRFQKTILVPAEPAPLGTTVTASITRDLDIELSGTSGTAYIDCVQVERSITATEYFDGSLPEEYGTVWGNNVPNNSISYKYPSLVLKNSRIANTLHEWTPQNYWWIVSTARGIEENNLTAL